MTQGILFSIVKAPKAVETVSKQVETNHHYTDQQLMTKVCKTASNSKLCNNWDLFNVLKSIAKNNNAPVWILLGIMAHESKFGTSYHKSNTVECRETTNNRHGSKGNNTANWVKKTSKIWPWCRLQHYDTIEEWFTSLARTIWVGYKWCMSKNNPIVCISYKYVWSPTISESSRVNHVKSFY